VIESPGSANSLTTALLPPCSSHSLMPCCVNESQKAKEGGSRWLLRFTRVRPDSPVDQWSNETSAGAKRRPLNIDQQNDWLSSKRPPLGKRRSRTPVRFLITFCTGVAATLAWQCYGDVARTMLANSSLQLSWLAPKATPLARAASNQVTPAEPTTPSPDLQQLKAISLDLAAVRQSVDHLAVQNQQAASDIATLQMAQQAILRKVSAPPPRQAAAPARNAVQN
jgi:hypothetical protein